MNAANIIALARVERDRLALFLDVITEITVRQEMAERGDLSDAAECLALEALVAAENRLIAMVTDPAFAVYFHQVKAKLTGIVETGL